MEESRLGCMEMHNGEKILLTRVDLEYPAAEVK